MKQFDFLNPYPKDAFKAKQEKQRLKVLLAFIIGLALFQTGHAQKVFRVKYPTDGAIKLYEVQDTGTADLVVYVTSDTTGTTSNNGIWITSESTEDAKKIFFVNNPDEADIRIYITTVRSDAGWLNTTKMSLLN